MTDSELEQRLNRIEEMLMRVEWRLENSKVFEGSTFYSSDALRYCLENDVDPTYFGFSSYRNRKQGQVDKEYMDRISDWLEEHESDSTAEYYKLESFMGGNMERSKIVKTLTVFYLSGMWTQIIAQLTGDKTMAPVEAKTVMYDEYGSQKRS